MTRLFQRLSMSWRGRWSNESEQYSILVENLVNDVGFPYKELMEEYISKSNESFKTIKYYILSLYTMLNSFTKLKWQYEDCSKELSNAVFDYSSFSKQATEYSPEFYKVRLFNLIGAKLIPSEDKVKECAEMNDSINKLIEEYTDSFHKFCADVEELQALKTRAIIDAINRIIIFETNWDMNNKYDTKGMADQVEILNKKQFEFKVSPSEVHKLDPFTFEPEDELRYIEFDYDNSDDEDEDRK